MQGVIQMKYKNMQDAKKVTGVRLKELREAVGPTPTMLGKKCNKYHNVILSIEKWLYNKRTSMERLNKCIDCNYAIYEYCIRRIVKETL